MLELRILMVAIFYLDSQRASETWGGQLPTFAVEVTNFSKQHLSAQFKPAHINHFHAQDAELYSKM